MLQHHVNRLYFCFKSPTGCSDIVSVTDCISKIRCPTGCSDIKSVILSKYEISRSKKIQVLNQKCSNWLYRLIVCCLLKFQTWQSFTLIHDVLQDVMTSLLLQFLFLDLEVIAYLIDWSGTNLIPMKHFVLGKSAWLFDYRFSQIL